MRRFTSKLGLTLKQELNRNFKNGHYHDRRSTHFLFFISLNESSGVTVKARKLPTQPSAAIGSFRPYKFVSKSARRSNFTTTFITCCTMKIPRVDGLHRLHVNYKYRTSWFIKGEMIFKLHIFDVS